MAAVFLFIGMKSNVIAYTPPEASITAQIVDENGVVIQNQDVTIGFEGGGKGGKIQLKTDVQGRVTATYGTTGKVALNVVKDGYYVTSTIYEFAKMEAHRFLPKTYRWLPWNPEVKLVLRKIGKPVPMYARDTNKSGLEFPAAGKAIGFDLIEYSWMPPHGHGKHADFYLKLEKRYVSDDDFDSTLTITFPSKFDGIQLVKEDRRNGSMFKLPRFAPEDGYQQKLIKRSKRTPAGPYIDDFEDNNNYIFRVRSEMREGKLLRALYGKIQGDVTFSPRVSKTANIGFTYYLNPDYSRNLEYDRKRNLFGNLPSLERVDQ